LARGEASVGILLLGVVPGQQFFEAIDWVSGDQALENVAQVGEDSTPLSLAVYAECRIMPSVPVFSSIYRDLMYAARHSSSSPSTLKRG
jgi:hypothetical protein